MAFNGMTKCVVRKTKSLGCAVILRNAEVKSPYKLQILGRKIISYALVCVLKESVSHSKCFKCLGTVILHMTAKRKIPVFARNQIHLICFQPFYWINCPPLTKIFTLFFMIFSLTLLFNTISTSIFNLLDNMPSQNISSSPPTSAEDGAASSQCKYQIKNICTYSFITCRADARCFESNLQEMLSSYAICFLSNCICPTFNTRSKIWGQTLCARDVCCK